MTLEFFLNEFQWIQWIQWIMTKIKSGMVTKVITHLPTDTLPVLIIKSAFSLLLLVRYLLPVTTWNRYQFTDSSGKFSFTTTSRNATIVRCRMSLVTIMVLDFVMTVLGILYDKQPQISCFFWQNISNDTFDILVFRHEPYSLRSGNIL